MISQTLSTAFHANNIYCLPNSTAVNIFHVRTASGLTKGVRDSGSGMIRDPDPGSETVSVIILETARNAIETNP